MLHQRADVTPRSFSELNVDRVSVSIGKTPIVRNISFTALAGEFLAIIGPSGSGKTTLLKAMTGEIAYGGHVFLAGAEIRGLAPESQALIRAVLPQHSQISFPLTVAEVIGLGMISGRQSRVARGRRVAEALMRVGLAGFEGRNYQDLSGGEQQRVQLARVLCQVWKPVPQDAAPRWLFLDEPVSSLDIKHQYQIMQLARDYAAAGGGVVAVMHDLNLTSAFADKVLVMKEGRSLALGGKREVMRANLLTQAYDFPLSLIPGPEAGTPIVVPGHQNAG